MLMHVNSEGARKVHKVEERSTQVLKRRPNEFCS